MTAHETSSDVSSCSFTLIQLRNSVCWSVYWPNSASLVRCARLIRVHGPAMGLPDAISRLR